jgi:hypothetical protein
MLIALAVAAIGAAALHCQIRRARIPIIALASIFTLYLLGQITLIGWKITKNPRGDSPSFYQLAAFVHANLPDDAVLLLEPREKGEYLIAMFQVDRTIYPVMPTSEQETARQVRAAGGVPYLLTNRAVPLPLVSSDFLDGLHVYSFPGSALQQSP